MKELVLHTDSGYKIIARNAVLDGRQAIGIRWQKPDGERHHQELWLFQPEAAKICRAIAEFAEMTWTPAESN